MTTSLRQSFIEWYFEEFQKTSMYTSMAMTIEDSPWHRERSVATHTDMVVAQYISRSNIGWFHEDLRGAMACVFHDVGKPAAEETRFKPERGEYRAYTGHEIVSARMWEEFAMLHWAELEERFEMVDNDVYAITWMIEHHLPYGVKKADKVEQILRTANYVGGTNTFGNVLIADGFGRISDDAEVKRANVMEYVDSMKAQLEANNERWLDEASEAARTVLNNKAVYLLIGASGSGKSTWTKNSAPDADVYSWDALRHEWYHPTDYTEAFKLACEDKHFNQKAQQRFREVLAAAEGDVVVDNVNLTKKSRRFFVDTARQKGFAVIGVLFPIDRQTLRDRQASRTDKVVPVEAVMQHWNKLQMPMIGEVDKVMTILP